MTVRVGRKAAAVAGVAALSLVLAACGSDVGGDDATATDDAAAGGDSSAASEFEIDCSVYEQFGDLSGTTVSVYTSIREPEASEHMASYVPFEECTGIDIQPEWSSEFEAQVIVRVQGGNAPDLALYQQPGGIQSVQDQTGAHIPVPD